MAVLTTKVRKKLPKSEFGIPSRRGFPMPDVAHAVDAKARAHQAYNAGRMSKSQFDHIVGMANEVIAKKQSNGG